MPVIFLVMAAFIALSFGLVYIVSRKQKVVLRTVWDCGFNALSPRMEITATGFSRTLILIFRGIFQPSKQHEIEYVDADIRYFSKSKTVTLGIVNIYEAYLYYPLHNGLSIVSKQIRKIQSGNVNQYLLYIFILLLGLLIFARY